MHSAVVPLLAIAVFINYVDRGNLATAAPLMKDALGLSASQIGILLSAFYWTYVPGQLLAGFLAERFDAYRTLALGLAIWAVATAVTGLASTFAVLIALRLLLGLGESAAFPCSSKLLAQHLPCHSLGRANGLISVGLALGPAFGTFAGGMLMAQYGWRALFIVLGLISLSWLVPWFAVTRIGQAELKHADPRSGPGVGAILLHPALWAAGFGHFSSNYAFYFVIFWLPLYLVKVHGFTVPQMATLAGMIYLVYAASASLVGWFSDRLIASGQSVNRVRKVAIIASHVGVALAMLGCAFGNTSTCIASLFVAGVFFGPGSAMVFTIGQTLAGPQAAGRWIGVQNCVGNLSGIIGPIVTGFVVDKMGGFFWAFAISCAVTLAGIFFWGIGVGRIEPVAWTQTSSLSKPNLSQCDTR
jgi:MFS family permease